MWYKNNILKYLKETYIGAIFPIIFALITLIILYGFGYKYEWKTIEPISQPEIFVRIFYSALVFITLGAFLYYIKFYKLLHFIFVKVLGEFKLYRKIKWYIWTGLTALMFMKIVPFVVDVLNAILSFLYNLVGLFLYSAPAFGITLIIFLIVFFGFVYIKENKKIT